MKAIATTLIIFMMTAVFACGAKNAQNAQKQADSTAYNSPEGRYSVLMPGKPELSSQEAPAHTGQKLTQYLAVCEDPDRANDAVYIVAYFDLAPDMVYKFDEARDGYIKAVNGTLVSEKPIQLGKYAGRELRASAVASGKELILLARFYLVEKRVYLIQFLFDKSAESPRIAAKGAKFFDSFALAGSH
jgi:hypothetical protein